MTKLCKCPNCNCRFKNIGNMSKHRWKEHPSIVKGQIRNGMKNSTKTPTAKVEKQQKAIRESLEFFGSVSAAVLTKNPIVALDALRQGIEALKAVQELR